MENSLYRWKLGPNHKYGALENREICSVFNVSKNYVLLFIKEEPSRWVSWKMLLTDKAYPGIIIYVKPEWVSPMKETK